MRRAEQNEKKRKGLEREIKILMGRGKRGKEGKNGEEK